MLEGEVDGVRESVIACVRLCDMMIRWQSDGQYLASMSAFLAQQRSPHSHP